MQYLYTKQAEQAIDYALRTAHEFHQEVLSSEYILAGLLCVPEGVAGSVLGKVPVEL